MTSDNHSNPLNKVHARLPSVYGWLCKQNPILFIGFYALSLILFACLFYTLPMHSLYAPYARFEPNAYNDGLVVINDITRALTRPQRHSYSEMGFEWTIDPKTIRISKMTSPALSRLEFNVSFAANTTSPNRPNTGQSYDNFNVAIDLHPQFAMPFERKSHYVHRIELVGPQSAFTSNSRAELFRLPDSAGINADTVGPAIDLDSKGQSDLNAFLVGLSGEPSEISGFFWRMLYLSATTITTTGFGDIVPLSGTARFLCGAEAIAGWLLAGLFLNSAAWRAARHGNSV